MLTLSGMSERRACRLAGLSRDAYRNPPMPSAHTQALKRRLIELAQARRRFGYRRLHDLLRLELPDVNHKKIYRLHRESNLAVRRSRKPKRPDRPRQPLQQAQRPNAVWGMDFVSDALANGRRLKCLTVVDDFTRECVQMATDHGINSAYVIRLLDEAARSRGYPAAVRTDNGPEFISHAFQAWTQKHHIQHLLIEPGKPMQNGYIESFNGKFCDECLTGC